MQPQAISAVRCKFATRSNTPEPSSPASSRRDAAVWS